MGKVNKWNGSQKECFCTQNQKSQFIFIWFIVPITDILKLVNFRVTSIFEGHAIELVFYLKFIFLCQGIGLKNCREFS